MSTTRTNAAVIAIVAINLAFIAAALKKYPRVLPGEVSVMTGNGMFSTLCGKDGNGIVFHGSPPTICSGRG